MKVILFVGEMGSGKSYLARKLASDLGLTFIEGDDLASQEMKTAIDGLKMITDKMIDELVVAIDAAVADAIERTGKGVVVAQALYREKHRHALITSLRQRGFIMDLRWVRVGLKQHLSQLRSRPGGIRWILYWLMSKPFFQQPRFGSWKIVKNRRLEWV